ncbi:unnamed protein product [Rhizophagus irregularis]|nr:unnamed protein product [Rhizophagus irregularis]
MGIMDYMASERSLDDLKSIWRKRYLCFLSNCLIREEEHDNGAKERIAFLIQQKRPPEEESFWNGVRLDKELMIREDVFDKKSQIEALDVLCVSRSRKSNIKLYWNRLMARKKGYHNRTKAITRVISMDMKSTYNDLTFSDEGSSSFISLTNVFSEISSHKSETISPLTTNEIKTVIPVIEENEVPSSPEPEIVPINLTNTFLATSIKLDKKAESNTSLAGKNKKIKNQYISRDIAEEALKTYQVRVLANEKLIYNDVDVLDLIHSKEIEKGPLSIGVINLNVPNTYLMTLNNLLLTNFKIPRSRPSILLKDEALINL